MADETFTVTKDQLDKIVAEALARADAAVAAKYAKAPPIDEGKQAEDYMKDHPSFAKYLGKEVEAEKMGMKEITE